MDLDVVADALYALPREEFTPARDARAKEAKAGGDRELARAIGRLRRPTVAAWLVNRLAREDPDRLTELADLGESMRAAHDRLDGSALRELSAQRRTLLSALTDAARAAGGRAGTPVSETVTRELEEIFTASLASADAARALSLGRLTTAKELADAANHWPNATLPRRVGTAGTPSRRSAHSESASSARRVDGPGTTAAADRGPADEDRQGSQASRAAGPGAGPRERAPATADTVEPARPSAAVLRARRELAELEDRLADSERRHAEAEADHERAAEEESAAHRAVADLRAELIAAEQAERNSRQRARTARRAQEDTERALRETRRRVAVARERLTALDNG